MLRLSPTIRELLLNAAAIGQPDWYLGAGGVAGTVWNLLHGYDVEAHIKDWDLVYFDASDLSYDAEDLCVQRASSLFGHLRAPVEVRNQARVHLWYEEHFGYPIEPCTSLEDAIASWPTTATSVGVRREPDGQLRVYAPHGLEDLFGLIVRPNKRQITRDIYLEKVERWRASWPKLQILAWDD
jgi:hypothetical protein